MPGHAGQRRSGPRWEARSDLSEPGPRSFTSKPSGSALCPGAGAQTFAIEALESGGRDAAPRRILSDDMRPVRRGGEAACLDRAMGWVLAPLRNADRADRWAGER